MTKWRGGLNNQIEDPMLRKFGEELSLEGRETSLELLRFNHAQRLARAKVAL